MNKVKIPIGAHALITFGEKPIVITEDYIDESEKWFERSRAQVGWNPVWCEEQSWMVLLNGAYQSTDFDPNERYIVEKGRLDHFFVVDTTRMPTYYSETKFVSLALCYLRRDAAKIAKALNEQLTARRKNG